MSSIDEKDVLRARIITASINTYLLSRHRILYDAKGNEHIKPYRVIDLAKELKVGFKTIHRWRTLGRIAKYYKKELIRLGVLKEGDLDI